MKLYFVALILAVSPLGMLGQSPGGKTAPPQHPNAPASQEIQTEEIGNPGKVPASASTQASNTGYLEPAQLKTLSHKIWLAQYRMNDLIAQVHSEKWKMQASARTSFDQSLESLRKSIAAEEDWRSQFDARPDSLYLGFQTYMAMGAVLPRVEGVARSVAQYENASFGGQYSQAANQLFDLQQSLAPHLTYLMKNQDNVLMIAQANMASCQNELSFAEHGKEGRATPMKNIAPVFQGRKRTAHATLAPSGAGPAAGKGIESPKPAETRGTGTSKSAPNPPNKSPTK